MKSRATKSCACAFAFIATPILIASFSHSNTTPPGGFAQAGATDIDSLAGGGITPGQDLQIAHGTPNAVFDEQAFTSPSSAFATAAFSTAAITNSADAFANMGLIKLAASNSNDVLSGAFPGGRAHGGFRDTLTVTPVNPALNGTTGFFVFTMNVSGSLSATGANGLARLNTAVYSNSNSDLSKNSYFDDGASDPISTDRQRVQWGVSTFAAGESEFRTIIDTITLSVPMTFGASFDMAFYAYAIASTRSQASASSGSTASALFNQNGITYGGIVGVYTGGDPVNDLLDPTDYSVGSSSGQNWSLVLCAPDLDGDGMINGADLAALLASWGPCAGCSADLNGDGVVDGADLAAMLAAWGAC